MIALGTMIDVSFVWVLEFGTLKFVCGLELGAWKFHDFHGKQFSLNRLIASLIDEAQWCSEMKSMNKWKDRGWWLAVEIDQRPAGRKDEAHARDLLDGAQERYDLLTENGKTISRGIFTIKAEFRKLAELLELSNRWTGTVVHANGNRLGTADVHHLAGLLQCAGNQPGCRSESLNDRLAYLGCHRLRIGLMNYSLACLKRGRRYWFSYLRPEKGNHLQAALDKCALTKTMESSQLCPLFPKGTAVLIEKLPSTVNLRPLNNHLFWVPTKYKIRTHWLSRFPPAVPNSEVMYRQWMEKICIRFYEKD